jgi:hypothetical protein
MQRKLVPLAARRAKAAILIRVAGMTALCAGGAARAQGVHPPITLEVSPCADVASSEVWRLVTIELGSSPITGASVDPREATRVLVGCVPQFPLLVRLEVRDPTTGKSLDRIITLSGVPRPDQARLVAIAAVELVAASWNELRHASESVPHAVDATASTETRNLALSSAVRQEREPDQPRWRVFVVGSARGLGGMPRLLPGGGLAAARTIAWGLGVGVDVVAEGAAQPTPLGNVDTFLVSSGVVGLLHANLGPVTWESGLGARAGWAHLAGRGRADPLMPVRGATVSEPWAGPLVMMRGLLALPRRLILSVGGEVGYVTADVFGRVAGAADVAVRGLWWNAVLGVGVAY